MRKFFACAGVAGLLMFLPARTDASAIETQLAIDPQLSPAPPVLQKTEVWFQRPVRVDGAILQGRYVIEHDNERMARGEPCTRIYAYADQTTPVVAFHCTHLERDRTGANIVVVYPIGDGSGQVLSEFQFAGEHFAHGVPVP